jgi:hypothetical protein
MNKETRNRYKYNLNRKIELMDQFNAIRDDQLNHTDEWNRLKKEWRINEDELAKYPVINTSPIRKDYWDGKFTGKVTKQHKVCICTNVMNRLGDISKTLPANIEALKSYPNLEFTLLNYGDTSGLDKWVKDNMMEHIESGLLKYYRILDKIDHYSMGHSRNVCLRLAGGLDNASHDVIVNQVDADNYLKHKDPKAPTFAEYVNMLANEVPNKCIFGKGKRMMNGRIGFYKDEFLMLGGYDQSLSGYGHDDRDLYNRAMCLGYKLAWYGGQYVNRIHTPRSSKVENMAEKDWRYTEQMNKLISVDSLEDGRFVANIQRHWGKATVMKNFKEEMEM